MESRKDTTTGENLFAGISECIERLQLPWEKLISITTDGCPNLTGKNVGLLKKISDKVTNVDPSQELMFLHQEAFCNSCLDFKHIVNPVVKLMNFIRDRGLNPRQFIGLLDDANVDYYDVLYHSNVHWLSLGKVLK